MKRLPADSIDLVVTSPPYDNIRSYDRKYRAFDFEKTAEGLLKIMKPNGVIVWVVGDQALDGNESGTSFKQALHFKEIGFKLVDTMIYNKAGVRVLGTPKHLYWQNFEYMFIFSKGKPETNLIEDKISKHYVPGGRFNKFSDRNYDGTMTRKRKTRHKNQFIKRTNVWTYKIGFNLGTNEKVAYEHPAIFPDQLAFDHIRTWSNEGDIVYDPFMGSGTVASQSIRGNRKYLGSEINEKYIDIINKRIEIAKVKYLSSKISKGFSIKE